MRKELIVSSGYGGTCEGGDDPRHCAGRINTALDLLETDPGNERNRRRRFNTIGLWGIAVLCGDDERLILWEPHDDNVVVRHIIPAALPEP